MMADKPLLLLGFNRPDCVAQLVDALRIVKPMNVFIAMDGSVVAGIVYRYRNNLPPPE